MSPFPRHLLEGYRTFTSQRLPTEQSRYRELSEIGQAPEVMVIGCCDSRVSPEVIFDAGPGELFVMRNIANLVPVYQPDANAHGVSAALEYAVSVLRIKHIVVLGHAQCGGIRAFIDKIEPLSPGDFIGKWMSMFIKPGETVSQRDHETMAEFTVRIEKAAVFRSLENLLTFPFVRTAVERGELSLHGAYFGVAEGSLFVLDQATKEFYTVRDKVGASVELGESSVRHSLFAIRLFECSRYPLPASGGHAAFFLALISLRLTRHSAIWIAFRAAPLRRLSETHHSTKPLSTVGSSRMRLI
jgi:carbonic anhydrase